MLRIAESISYRHSTDNRKQFIRQPTMFETTFRNLDDTLRKDAGCSSELDYIEQTSWVLFLKYLDDFEADREAAAKLNGERYQRILSDEYAWTTWAMPKTADGKLDYNRALTGDDLKEFVDNKLFPYLKSFRVTAERADTIEYKIGEIFHELKNKLQSGYSLREVITKVDELRFRSNEEKHEMSSLYEDKIKNMGNAGRNGGEYYTPRPLIKTIVKVVNPKLGDKVYDGAVGSAGFLCEAYEFMRTRKQLTAKEFEQLQRNTFYGKEKKSLAYIIGVMNMILHGIEAPNIIHTNTLGENIADIQEKDRVDIVLANPPFGGKERVGIVVKSTFLTANDTSSVSLRKQLLSETELEAVLILPKGVFTKTPATTVVLFFTKGSPTEKIWFYKLKPKENFGINNPILESHLEDFVSLFPAKSSSDNSWTVLKSELKQETLSLPIRHPNASPYEDISPSSEIRSSLIELSKETQKLMEKIGAAV
jgi:type I restriction enzyme M protein